MRSSQNVHRGLWAASVSHNYGAMPVNETAVCQHAGYHDTATFILHPLSLQACEGALEKARAATVLGVRLPLANCGYPIPTRT